MTALSEIEQLLKDLTPRQSRLLRATMFGPETTYCGVDIPAGVSKYLHDASHDKWWDFHKTFKMDAVRAIRKVEQMPDYKAKRWDTTTLAWVDA